MGKEKETPQTVDSLQADTEKGATQPDQFENRLTRYGRAKDQAVSMSQYIRHFQPNQAKTAYGIESCANYLVFNHYYTVGQIKLAKVHTCKKHLLCPFCAIRRGSLQVGHKKDQVKRLLAEHPSYELSMMTLTVKDGHDLLERYKHLTKSIREFMKRRHRTKDSLAKKILGAVWSIEVKRGKNSGQWHPHAHFVIVTEKANQLSQEKLSKEWHQITGDSYIVDIRPISADSEEAMIKGFCEVFKYAIKFSDQPHHDTWHCYQTLQGRRLVGSVGLLYGIKEPEELTDTLLEDLPYVEYFYRYVQGRGFKNVEHRIGEYQTPVTTEA